jgi:hypothetical protein
MRYFPRTTLLLTSPQVAPVAVAAVKPVHRYGKRTIIILVILKCSMLRDRLSIFIGLSATTVAQKRRSLCYYTRSRACVCVLLYAKLLIHSAVKRVHVTSTTMGLVLCAQKDKHVKNAGPSWCVAKQLGSPSRNACSVCTVCLP